MSDGDERLRAIGRPLLMLVTEPIEGLPRIVADAVSGGVDIVQWRTKGLPEDDPRAESGVVGDSVDIRAALAAVATAMRSAAGGALLVVNGPLWLARMAKADGVHLPETDARVVDSPLVGRSVHSASGARAAVRRGADYLVAGTIYPSPSHPGGAVAGPGLIGEIRRSVDAPLIAIGGIAPKHVSECHSAGASGIAVISEILHSRDPRGAAAEYRVALDAILEN